MTRQPDLFGDDRVAAEPSAPRRRSGRAASIGAASVSQAIAHVADAVPPALRLGTSSWSFPGWAGIVYDRAASTTQLSRQGLAAYAQHPLLRAVGLDRTFYAPIDAEDFAQYAAQVPPDFRFLVKAHAALTAPSGRLAERGPDGTRRFLDAAYASDVVIAPAAEGLGERLGVVLFQFPPLSLAAHRWAGFVNALGVFLAALPRDVRCAVEIRDSALLTDATLAGDYAAALADAGVTHCPTVHPTMPGVRAQFDVLGERAFPAGLVPVRWMLQGSRSYEEARDAFAPFDRMAAPDPGVRGEVADVIDALLSRQHEVIVIANNKAEGSAPRTLEALAEEVVRRRSGPA